MSNSTEALAVQWAAGHRSHGAEAAARVENAYKCLRLVRVLFPLGRVADFGCGIGGWLEAARLLGATELCGFEGEWIRGAETVIAQDLIETVDLATRKLDLRKHYDLALSIEVAEHLPEAAAQGFCETLVSAADRIVFSAATPGQGGLGHINEQKLAYWVRKFWHLGYVPLELFRPYIGRDRSIYPWLRQNLVMFVSYDQFVFAPDLHRFARPLDEFNRPYQAS